VTVSANRIAAIVYEVCCLDVRALKPGNVSVYVPGHRMTATDFVLSAEVAAKAITTAGDSVGARVRCAVAATVDAVGCNTNLGIVLLLAPMVHAMLSDCSGPLQRRITQVLAALTVADASAVYEAIRLARPAGLGNVSAQDVGGIPSVDLRQAMALAADRDRIARQYISNFADIFSTGLDAIKKASAKGWTDEWCAVACYLRFLVSGGDSHVERKFGGAAAEAVSQRAAVVESHIKACDNPRTAVPILLKMDNKLKAEGVNPGTSADLTIASLAAWRFDALL
jgi:triphosphoribosyl-dephospho-CoA synthase